MAMARGKSRWAPSGTQARAPDHHTARLPLSLNCCKDASVCALPVRWFDGSAPSDPRAQKATQSACYAKSFAH